MNCEKIAENICEGKTKLTLGKMANPCEKEGNSSEGGYERSTGSNYRRHFDEDAMSENCRSTLSLGESGSRPGGL
jgi:hypothetical protein